MGEVFQKKPRTAASCFQLPTTQKKKSRKRQKKPRQTKRATCGGAIRRPVPAGGAEERPVPPRTLLQRRVNGTSKGTPKEGGGRRGGWGGTLVTYHRSKSSPLKLNSCCSVSLGCFYPEKRGGNAYNPQRSPRDASTFSPFRFESVCGVKNALERGGKKHERLFSLLLSPPYGCRLPCSSAALSCRRLQHRLSRQAGAAAHFKARNRLPGPDSRIKTTEAQCSWKKKKKNKKKYKRRFPDVSHRLWIIQIPLFFYVCIFQPGNFSPRFPDLSTANQVPATEPGPYQRRAILSQLPQAPERQK